MILHQALQFGAAQAQLMNLSMAAKQVSFSFYRAVYAHTGGRPEGVHLDRGYRQGRGDRLRDGMIGAGRQR